MDRRRLRRAAGGHHGRVPGRTSLNYLLDTHVLLWLLGEERVDPKVVALVADPHVEVYLSVASGWEIAIKAKLGKLKAPKDLRETLHVARIAELPVKMEHALSAGALPLHHTDPFDRMLVAQAQLERLTLVTSDPAMAAYDVRLLAAS